MRDPAGSQEVGLRGSDPGGLPPPTTRWSHGDVRRRQAVSDRDSVGSLFTTPHYDGHRAALIRLDDIEREELARYFEESYLLRAPPSLRRALDAPVRGVVSGASREPSDHHIYDPW